MTRLAEIIDELPEELRPLATQILDGIAEGLLTNMEDTIETILDGTPDDAYTTMLTELRTPQVINMLQTINNTLGQLREEAQVQFDVRRMFLKQLITLAFIALRKEVDSAL